MIEINNVSKFYRNNQVLNDINIRFDDDTINVITGPSGSGKSTLLRLIAGLDYPDSGTVKIDGCVVSSEKKLAPPYLRRIGYAFQSPALWPHMTVFENVVYGIHDADKEQAEERCDRLLEMLSVRHLKDRYPSQISGGEARRVALARALAPHPDIILLDESLVNLNPSLKTGILTIIKEWQKETRCILVYVTHDEAEAEYLNHNRLCMDHGKLDPFKSGEAQ